MPETRRHKFGASRTVLLVEIERYCCQPNCLHLSRVSLTKDEARDYTGFKCERCEEWNEDHLQRRDIPEWWEELTASFNENNTDGA